MIPSLFIKLLGPNWKTSLNGILAFLIVTLSTLTTALGVANGIHVSAIVSGSLTLALGLCRAWVGLIQTDAK